MGYEIEKARRNFCRPMLCISAAYALNHARLSVCHVRGLCRNEFFFHRRVATPV